MQIEGGLLSRHAPNPRGDERVRVQRTFFRRGHPEQSMPWVQHGLRYGSASGDHDLAWSYSKMPSLSPFCTVSW